MKPLIGVPGRDRTKRETVEQARHYLDAAIGAGGLPVVIPPTLDRGLIREYAQRLDGILLPGSSTDVDPAIYNAEPHPQLGKRYPERDATDFELLRHADETGTPLLGICFGVQSLNVHRGGTLVQDIPSLVLNASVHELDDEAGGPARHAVRLREGTRLASLAGCFEADVNSYHHQAVDCLGANLRVAAMAPDGVVEAVEDSTGRFVVGVQWHPERGWREAPLSLALFASFVAESRRFMESRSLR